MKDLIIEKLNLNSIFRIFEKEKHNKKIEIFNDKVYYPSNLTIRKIFL